MIIINYWASDTASPARPNNYDTESEQSGYSDSDNDVIYTHPHQNTKYFFVIRRGKRSNG